MSSLPPFDMELYDDAVPPFKADNYTIQVTQSVTLPEPFESPQPYQFTQAVTVDGPHLALGTGDVVAVYPPAGSQYEYGEVLAHVVLNRRTLPWEIPADPTGATNASWLAVLLFEPDEIVWAAGTTPDATTGVQTVALSDYLEPPDGTLGPAIPSAEQAAWWVQYGPNARANVVDVTWEAFSAIAPQLSELSLLAHVRQTNTGGMSIQGVNENGWYGVVVGNRLPQGNGMYIAHLVSVEGYSAYLPGGDGSPSAGQTVIRLLSLTSWTFNTIPGADFTALMENLTIDVLQLPPQFADGLPADAAAALASGYTAVEYQTRLGEPTTAWYRGPCLPVWMEVNEQPPYPSAGAALLYDPSTGMFDVSYAAAWQTGRLLALANRQFVVSILGWMNQNTVIWQQLVKRLTFFEDHEFIDAPPDDLALLEPGSVERAVRKYVAAKLAKWMPARGGAKLPLGPPADPSGLQPRGATLRGLLGADQVGKILASGIEPNAGIVAAIRARRKRS